MHPFFLGLTVFGGLFSVACYAGDAGSTKGSTTLERVVVSSDSQAEAEKSASISLQRLSKSELAKSGETSLVQAMARIPSITVESVAGNASRLKFRGLGGGYVQVLVDGVPAPAGFSIDAVLLDAIEAVEVRAVSSAEYSSGIAATVNIIFLKKNKTKDVSKGTIGMVGAKPSVSWSLGTSGDLTSSLRYTADANFAFEGRQWDTSIQQIESSPTEGVFRNEFSNRIDQTTDRIVNLRGRATRPMGNNEEVWVEGAFRGRWRHLEASENKDNVLDSGSLFEVGSSDQYVSSLSSTLSIGGKWSYGPGAFEIKSFSSNLRFQVDSKSNEYSRPNIPESIDNSLLRATEEINFLQGKYKWEGRDAHRFGLGFEFEAKRRHENWTLSRFSKQLPVIFDDNGESDVSSDRIAMYLQDEIELSSSVLWVVGGRTENAIAKSEISSGEGQRSYGELLPSTSLQFNLSKDESLKISLARSFKLPDIRDQVTRRIYQIKNSPISPDIRGNPSLLPETAWSLEASYDGKLNQGARFGAGIGFKHIEDVVATRMLNEGDSWIQFSQNFSRAEVASVDMSIKGSAAELFGGSSQLKLRLSLSRNWSSVYGADRSFSIEGQNPWVGNLGIDYKLTESPYSVGAVYIYASQSRGPLPDGRSYLNGETRLLDLYAAANYKWGKLTFALSNVLETTAIGERQHEGQSFYFERAQAGRPAAARFTIEIQI